MIVTLLIIICISVLDFKTELNISYGNLGSEESNIILLKMLVLILILNSAK